MMAVWMWLCVAWAGVFTAEDAVDGALNHSAEVAQGVGRVEAAQGSLRSATGPRFDPWVTGRIAAVGELMAVGVVQPLSLSAEGVAARQSARAGVRQAEASLVRRRLEVAALARATWADAVEAGQRVRFTEQALALAIALRQAAQARFEAGEGSSLDARLAWLQETEARATYKQERLTEARARVALARLVGAVAATASLPEDPLDALPAGAGAGAERADLLATQAAVEAARAQLSQARRGVLPPLQLGAFVEQEGPEFRAGPQIRATLPVFERNARERGEARAAVTVATAELAALEGVVAAEQHVFGELAAELERVPTEVDMAGEARLALESVAAGYQAGELDLLTAGLLRQQVLQGQLAELRERRLRVEARIALALAVQSSSLLGD